MSLLLFFATPLTAVSSTIRQPFDLRQSVTKSVREPLDARGQVTKDLREPLNLAGKVTKDVREKFDVLNVVGKSTSTPFTVSNIYRDAVMATSGLLSYWRLEEGPGATVMVDEKGVTGGTYGANSSRGVAGLLAGTANKAMSIDAFHNANAEGILGGDAFDFAGRAPFTWEVWIKPDVLTNNARIISKETFGTNRDGYALMVLADGRVDFWRYLLVGSTSDSVTAPAGSVAVGRAAHLVVTYDGTTLTLYVNGALRASTTSTTNEPGNTSNLYLGSNSTAANAAGFQGTIDEPAVYNRALTEQEVADHYRAGTLPSPVSSTVREPLDLSAPVVKSVREPFDERISVATTVREPFDERISVATTVREPFDMFFVYRHHTTPLVGVPSEGNKLGVVVIGPNVGQNLTPTLDGIVVYFTRTGRMV